METRGDLSEYSSCYAGESHMYERFSQYEDAPGKISVLLRAACSGISVLDCGCGTGKFSQPILEVAASYFGFDRSVSQVRHARIRAPEARFAVCELETLSLGMLFDLALASWVLGTIVDQARRQRCLQSIERCIKAKGKIVCIENAENSEFERIRGRTGGDTRTADYNRWLEANGFSAIETIHTCFEFASVDEARSVFDSIWGAKAASSINGPVIEHTVLVFEKTIYKTR